MNQPRGREQLLAEAFVSLADTLVDDYDVIDLLTRLIHYSVRLMDADAGGIMLADASGVPRVVATSDDDARLIESLQLQHDEGPCLEAYRTATAVRISNLESAGTRFPLFVEAALRRPVFHAVHAVPLRLRGTAIGALNLWHYEPHTLPKGELALGQALADVATIAILQERAIRRGEVVNEQLQAALTSRVIIEQAKGLLAQHTGLGMTEAFELMRQYARSHNQRLAMVARALAERAIEPEIVVAASPRPPKV